MGEAVAAAGTPAFIPIESSIGVAHPYVKGFYKLHSALNILFGSRNVQDQIAKIIRGHFRPKDVDDQIVLFHQILHDRFLSLAVREVEKKFPGDGTHASPSLFT